MVVCVLVSLSLRAGQEEAQPFSPNSPMLACHEGPTAPKLWDGGSSLSMVRAPCVFLRASVLIRARLFLRLKICRPMKDALVPSYQRRVAHGASSPSRSSLKRHG